MRLIQKRSKLTWHHLIIFGILFMISLLSFAQQSCKEVIGYYPNWQWYDRAKLVNPNSIDYSKYTIINYSFFDIDTDGNIEITDPWADKNLLLGPINWATAPAGYDASYDFGNPAYHIAGNKFSDICHANNVKLLPSIGGWTLSTNFPGIAADPVKRQNFANSCVSLIDAFGFDGIDIDWEYPGYAAHGGTPQDKVNFTLFLQEIRTAIDNYGIANGKTMILTAAVGANEDRMDDVEWNNVSPILDAINLMSYDFFGAFSAQANHNSPLNAPLQGDPTFNLSSAVDKLVNFYNVDPNKINAGVAFYGRSAKTVSTPSLFATTTGAVDNITFPEDDGSPLYYNIQKKMNQFNYNWDNVAEVSYLTGKNGLNTFVSYDDVRSIGLKAEYIIDNNLRGAIIWEITGDYIETFPGSGVILNTPLADTLNNVLCNYTGNNNNQPPTITCPSNQTIQASNGTSAALPDYTNVINVLLNCSTSSNFSITQSPVAGTMLSLGSTQISTTVTDGCGNVSTCSFFVNVTNGSTLIWSNQPGNANLVCDESTLPINTGNALASSTCGSGTVTINYSDNTTPGSCANSTTISRTWTAADNCGNTITYVQSIAISDNIAPTIVCPASQNLTTTNGTNATLPDYTSQVSVSDNCSSTGNVTVSQSPSAGSTQNLGTISINITATDECGNASNCTFNVTINDNSSLNWTNSPGHTSVACDETTAPSNTGNAAAYSTCALGTVTIQYSDIVTQGSCVNASFITRTWTATDNCGNSITYVQSIIVSDNVAPVISCPTAQTLTSSNGINATMPDYSNLTSVSDNCSSNGDIIISQTPPAGSIQLVGTTSVTINAKDECGNMSNCTFNVNIINNSTLVWANQPGQISLACDASITPNNSGDATAISTCGTGTTTVSYSDYVTVGSCPNSSSIIRTWVATDNCGNTIAYAQSIEISDYTSPVINCPADQNLTSSEGVNIQLPDFTNQVVTTDNCSNASDIIIVQSPPAGTMLPIGVSSINITASDECGNSETCLFNVEVVSTVGISNNEKLEISLFPNPFESNFTINFSMYNDYNVEVRDALGRLVESIQFSGNSLHMHNYAHYASGTYYVKIGIQDGEEFQFHKIVKK